MPAGPANQLLKERIMAAQQPPACPYTITAGEPTSNLVGGDRGSPIRYAPCIGGQCMAFATIPTPDGKVRATCQRLIVGQMLDNIAGMLEAGVLMFKADLDARGVAIQPPPGAVPPPAKQ